MSYYKDLVSNGIETIKDKNVIVCSIVRNCEKNLRHNIPCVEKLCSYFKDYTIIVYENNSIDQTKNVLLDWSKNNNNVIVEIKDFNEDKYECIPIPINYNSSNCKKRIKKMVDYRNQYMEYIDNNNLVADYIIVVDLDVANISISGVISSFGSNREWDAIAANSYSLSPKMKRRYHDTYALVEYGMENFPQSEKVIDYNRYIWAHIRKNLPFIRVYSAYGGLTIYRYSAIKGLRYSVIDNSYGGVEVRCEHFSLHKQMAEKGCNKTYVNPAMSIFYQRVDLSFILSKLSKK